MWKKIKYHWEKINKKWFGFKSNDAPSNDDDYYDVVDWEKEREREREKHTYI